MFPSAIGDPEWNDWTPRVHFTRRFGAKDAALRLYGILDADSCARLGLGLVDVASAWHRAGVRLIQYRDKSATRETILTNARALRKCIPAGHGFLILNDRPDLVDACGFDGAHIGQSDAEPGQARDALGPGRILGVSTHSADQARIASSTEADYIAVGPVYATHSKPDAEAAVSLCGVEAARAQTAKPLVAIGGIGLGEARAVRMAGADSIAVISALLTTGGLPAISARAQDFLARLK